MNSDFLDSIKVKGKDNTKNSDNNFESIIEALKEANGTDVGTGPDHIIKPKDTSIQDAINELFER